MDCVILIGLPAAGKSTFYRDRLAASHDHISKDLLRNNGRPERRQLQLIETAFAAGRSVAVDNTNATRASRSPVIRIARAHGAAVHGYYFPTEAAEALRRNRLRSGRSRVPDVAIFAVRKHLEPPSFEEGFDRLFVVTLDDATRGFQIEEMSR
jgi:predicted kinase